MHLVVARHTLSGVIEHQAGAADARRVLGRYGGGAADYPDPLLACRRGQEILDRPFSLGLGELHLVGLVAADEVEVLRQRHELRAGGDRGGDQARCRAQVGLELGCRNHLDRRHPGLRHGDTDSLAGGMTASLLTLGSLQLPVIEKSCAKIWPSGFLRMRCAIAAVTPATGLTMPITVDAESPTPGTTRTRRFWVSCPISASPDICTSAAGPRMWKSRICITPC